jgi:hypothetical protein
MATTPGAPFNGIPMIGLDERPSACSVRPPKRPWLLSGSVVAPRDSARSADARLDDARWDGVGPPLSLDAPMCCGCFGEFACAA